MFKITVLYPETSGARFDHDYYRETHLPMFSSLLGEACSRYEIDQGLGGLAPSSAPPFAALCHVYCPSLEAFQAAMAQHSPVILADVANYTDIQPIMQISRIANA